MGIRFTLAMISTSIVFHACESSSMTKGSTATSVEMKLVESRVRNFFIALRRNDFKEIQALYPAFQKLEDPQGSDTAIINAVKEKEGTITVFVHNIYRNEKGNHLEKDVQLFFRPNSNGQFILIDSKGLTSFDKKMEYVFGLKSGCIDGHMDTTDQQVTKAMDKAKLLLPEKAFEIYMELKESIKVMDWNWELSDNGSAFGEGIVHNGSLYSLPNLKYKITYQNTKGDTIATDKGNVVYDALTPGESPTFSFYTSYVGKPSKAAIELVFDDDLVFTYLSKKQWTGKECEEYFRKHPEQKR